MDGDRSAARTVNTVLGPVPADELGVVAVHEALLSVVPGAEYAFDIPFDRAEIFESLAAELLDFREQGGGTIVDSFGMFHGRDVRLYESLSRATGVHIVASTGMGPEELLGGYFRTPQTDPPTPWPADRFAELFTAEITQGMVVPRVERRGAAGLVAVTATRAGMTATDESLFRGAARAALETGVPLSIRYGAAAAPDLEVVLDEELPAGRVVVGGLDRADALATGAAHEVARRGAYVALDHIGTEGDGPVGDSDRAALVLDLAEAGHLDRILLSGNATGVAKGGPARGTAFGYVLSVFVPRLRAAGLGEADIARILVDNPRELLSVR
ncbi:phosphotriesterase family protein [Nocardia sp. NPDC003345]